MPTSPVNYAHNLQLSTTAVDIISAVPTSVTEVVRKLSFRNSGSSTRTVTVHIVESSGTAGTANELAKKAIPAGKEWNVVLAQGEVLTTGMSLKAVQDSGTDVNANCSGRQVT